MCREAEKLTDNIGKFRIPRRILDEHDCEANAGQLLCKNKNKHRQMAAESLEIDANHFRRQHRMKCLLACTTLVAERQS